MMNNKFNRFLGFFLIAVLIRTIAIAQQSVLLNQTAFNTYVINPAVIGLSAGPAVNCHYKKNWLGFAESPEVSQLTIDGPFNHDKSAVGMSLLNEKAGISTNTYFSLAMRHRFKLSKESDVSFGISGGFNRQISDFAKFKAQSPEEFSTWPTQQSVTVPDASVGGLFRFKKLHIGISANHILSQNIVFKEPAYNSELIYKPLSNYILHATHTFQLTGDWDLAGNIIIRSTHGLPVQPDLSATIEYNKKVTLTCGWRPYYAIYAGIGANMTERFSVRYFYEYSRQINAISLGGHEIGIRFALVKSGHEQTIERSTEETDGVYEKIDRYDQEIITMRRKMDSLDQNLAKLKSEVERLKNQQLSPEEINNAIDHYFESTDSKKSKSAGEAERGNLPSKNYRIIRSSGDENQNYDTIRGNYRVVYGVYQLLTYAKEYQKLIKRETGLETVLIEIPGHPKKYLYVCHNKEHTALKPSLKQLKEVNKYFESLKIEITKGKPWILQISKD
jgi:type IX secretion system PorP/SprF family membrane protein